MEREPRFPPNGNENAYYDKNSNIFILDTTTWMYPEVRITVIAHEIGHIYSLHEQYLEDAELVCNNDVRSVMDGFFEYGGIWPCDANVYGPTPLDVTRVKAFWSGWEAGTPEGLKRAEPILTAVGINSWIVVTWADFAWAETFHRLDWYWCSSENGPWTSYRAETVTDDIGVHFYTGARTIRRDVNYLDYSPPVLPNSWHMVCGQTWSLQFGQWSNYYRCSNAVQLN